MQPFFDYIAKLQKENAARKSRIAFGVSIGITAVIFIIWISLLGVELRGKDDSVATEADVASPFKALSAAVGDTYAEVQQDIKTYFSQEATSGLTH